MHFIFDFFGTLVTYREGVRGNPVTRARAALSACGVELTADALTERLPGVSKRWSAPSARRFANSACTMRRECCSRNSV